MPSLSEGNEAHASLANTYQTKGSWKKAKKGYEDNKGNKWHYRRKVYKWKHGATKPHGSYYEYRNLIKARPVPKPKPEPDRTTIKKHDTRKIKQYDSPEWKRKVYAEIPTIPTSPNIEADIPSSAQIALYASYTAYLDGVDERNKELKRQLTTYYTNYARRYHWSKYFGSPELKKEAQNKLQEQINSEYNADKERKMSYQEWMINKRAGWEERESIITPTTAELQAAEQINENMRKFLTGMEKGWEVANQLYLPQAATLSALAEFDILKYPKYDKTRTSQWNAERRDQYYHTRNIVRNVAREFSQELTPTIQSISSRPQAMTYKRQYQQLNAQAKAQGIIKNDWVLRLHNRIPVKEKWRRLYVTLKSYIAKKQRKRK